MSARGRGRAARGHLGGKSRWVRSGSSEGQGWPKPVEWGGGSMGTGGHMGLKGRSCLAGGVEPCKFGGPITPHVPGRFMKHEAGPGRQG